MKASRVAVPCKRCGQTFYPTRGRPRPHTCPHGYQCVPPSTKTTAFRRHDPCRTCFEARQLSLFDAKART
jgi:hypothetical protein